MKKSINIRIDGDVLDWFKASGPGYTTLISSVLRSYVEAKKKGVVLASLKERMGNEESVE